MRCARIQTIARDPQSLFPIVMQERSASIGMIKIITMRCARIQTIVRRSAVFISNEKAGRNRKHWYDKNNNYALCKDPNNRPRSAVFISAEKATHTRKYWYDKNNNYALCKDPNNRPPSAVFISNDEGRTESQALV